MVTTIVFGYITFGLTCYFAWGSHLGESPLITSMLSKEVMGYIVKVAFCFNLFFTYPLVVYPANIIVEGYLFGHMPKSKKR